MGVRRWSVSQLELLALLQSPLDALAQRADAVAYATVELVLALLALEVLVRQAERRHHGDAIHSDHLAGVADLAHATVEELRGIEQRRALIVRAGNHVLLFHDAHAHPCLVLVGHAP